MTDGAVVMPAKEGTRTHAPAQAVPRGYAAALWVLLSLFVSRVVGQALVAFLDVAFLPPVGAWSTSPERNAFAILCALRGEKTCPGLARRLRGHLSRRLRR